jgi:hypothetical protein
MSTPVLNRMDGLTLATLAQLHPRRVVWEVWGGTCCAHCADRMGIKVLRYLPESGTGGRCAVCGTDYTHESVPWLTD